MDLAEEQPSVASTPLAIHLLGSPWVERGAAPAEPPRGRKAWALLAYLLATDVPASRDWLAELLFSDADDPLNALSWSLSQLRKLVGPGASLGGEDVRLTLPPNAVVDTHVLTRGTWLRALELPGLGRDLLAGMAFPASPAFEVWLLTERRRLAGAAEDVLREAARARLAAGDADGAAELAARLVVANPLDEDSQELLIRSLASGGDRRAAERQRDACIALFRAELGTDPAPAVIAAADVAARSDDDRQAPTSRAGIEARLEAASAAMDAGAIDTAIDGLRAAVAGAHHANVPDLEGRALLALGSALVHGVRGRDGEGAGMLLEAIGVTPEASTAHAYRELGYVEMLRGRYDRSQRWLREASLRAADDGGELAWAHAVGGVALSDIGRHAEAIQALRMAQQLGEEVGDDAVQAWALAFIGRSHLLRDELAEAREALERALAMARRQRWTAFVPLPEALLGNVHLAEGRIDEAAEAYEHAYELSLQLGDPCWEGMAARGIGLVADRRGGSDEAIEWLARARTRCVRLPDAWLWVEAYCLDALCGLAVRHGHRDADRWIGDLQALSSRTGMREMVARAYLHRAKRGDSAAADAARVLAAEVENPSLLAIG